MWSLGWIEMITIVLSYYNSGGMLDRHFAEWDRYPARVKDVFRAVIVDDGSPTDPAINHWRDPGFPCRLYRIKENIPWNIPGARNLGMEVAPEGWCLLTDIDHLLSGEQAAILAQGSYAKVDATNHQALFDYFIFRRRWADGRELHPHPNSYLIERRSYWLCGGTDEDWSGWWGAGEQVFRKCLHQKGGNPHLLDVTLIHYGRDDIADASTREWGRRDSVYDWRRNPELVAKAQGAAYRPVNPLRFTWERQR